MRCQECGEHARDVTLRYCENCGAKMPTPPPGAPRGAARPAAPPRGPTAAAARELRSDEDTGERTEQSPAHAGRELPREAPEEPRRPPYEGPLWLAHVPGHSPSVLGVGLQAVALALSILPFFAGVGPFWSLVVFAGGWVLVARELRAVGERHSFVDWVPESLMHPLVPALYAVVSILLGIRMLGLGVTPVLWAGGAALIGVDQYRKAYVGEEGWGRFFEPRQLLVGLNRLVLGGVVLCLVSLFFSWEPKASTYTASRGAVTGPPELRVMDATPPSSDVVYSLLDMPEDAGWDQPLSVAMALLLLGVLGLLALRPEVPRPDALRFAPVGVVVLGLIWMLVNGVFAWGPVLFLVGLLSMGFVVVYGVFMRSA
ncbi:MAG: hypothetical protein ABW123_18420 [Cystobacter sp.]